MAAVACLSSSVPASPKLVTRKTPCAPSNAALSVSGLSKSASTTSSASSRCLLGFRLRARTLNWLPACRARTIAPPCCPVAPITAISFSLLDNMSISLKSALLIQTHPDRRNPCLGLTQRFGARMHGVGAQYEVVTMRDSRAKYKLRIGLGLKFDRGARRPEGH